MIRRPPRSTRTDTLSLHDALPISNRFKGLCRKTQALFVFWCFGRYCCNFAADNRISCPQPAQALTAAPPARLPRSEEHTSELQSLMRISYAVFCLTKKKKDKMKVMNKQSYNKSNKHKTNIQ